MRHYSIDLETLGTAYNSYILSIGVAEFDLSSGEITGKFKENTVCDTKNFNFSIDTIMWWWMQSQEARESIAKQNKKHMLINALTRLYDFIKPNSFVWGNGATFDISILEYAYGVYDIDPPWKFWNVRDLRTLVWAGEKNGFDKNKILFEGTKHDCLHDAIHQAKIIHEAYHFIN